MGKGTEEARSDGDDELGGADLRGDSPEMEVAPTEKGDAGVPIHSCGLLLGFGRSVCLNPREKCSDFFLFYI